MADGAERDADGPGDRLRSEHRRLGALFHRTRAALARASTPPEAVEVFARLHDAVDGHLAQEDRLYYPPIRALRPAYRKALEALVAAHDDFRRRLADLAARLAADAPASALAGFDAFVRDFGRHEKDEERLLERIARELTAGGGARRAR